MLGPPADGPKTPYASGTLSETVPCTSPARRVAVVDLDRVVRSEGHGRLVIVQQGADHEVDELSILLRRAEGEAPWRSAIAMGSGVLFVALDLSGIANEAAVAFRAGDLDPQIARYAFDQGQAAFANGRVATGSFAVCCGWVIASTPFLPRWAGWLAIASGAGSHSAASAGRATSGCCPT
jgi:hypothetical protein